MIEKTVKIACMGATTLNLSQLNILQKDLKSLSHDDYEKYKKEIIDTGYAFPIKVWRDENKKFWIVGGTQSYRVLTEMQKEGWTIPLIPVTLVEAKDKKQAMRRVLQDASSYGKMESDGLYEFLQLAEMNIEDFNKSFRTPEIDHEEFKDEFFEQINDEGLTDEDAVPEVKESFVKLGDLWRLGDHRLLCGDATDVLQVEKLMNGDKAILLLTDPPYGVEYDANWRNEAASKGMIRYGTSKNLGKVQSDDNADWTSVYSIFDCQIAYVWHAGKFSALIQKNLEDCGYQIISQIIWAKPTFAISRGDYHWQHEPCWYAVKKGENHNWQGARDQSTLWKINRDTEVNGHSTPKPIELLVKTLLNNTKSGELVADPFGGSGSTLIACEKTKRKCFMMELDPNYCGVIIERWQQYTGLKAEKIN